MMDDEPLRELVATLMQVTESMLPLIEWAEGQRAMMVERGWSATTAEAYARAMLLGAARAATKAWSA